MMLIGPPPIDHWSQFVVVDEKMYNIGFVLSNGAFVLSNGVIVLSDIDVVLTFTRTFLSFSTY